MAAPRNNSYSVASGDGVYAGRPRIVPPVDAELVAAGGWTWYNDERAIVHGGNTFIAFNAGGGGSGHLRAARLEHGTNAITTGTITTAGSLDDHVCPGLVRLPSGLLAAFYAQNPDTLVRYRFSTAADSVTGWGSIQTTPTTPFPTVYVQPRLLPTSGRLILFSRCIIDSSTRRHYYNVSADNAGTWGSWVEFMRPPTTGIPYLIAQQSGDRIYLLVSTGHPVNGQASIYCGYAEWHTGDNALRFYRMDGTQLSLPFNPSSLTLVYDGSTQRAWNWDIAVGADGHPRVLFSRYPANNGTDIRMMYSRWDGAAFTTPVDVRGASVGTSLYAGEAFYTGGACFDGNDPDAIYLSAEVTAGVYELQKWRTNDVGLTWAKVRDISTGTVGQDNIRPISPVGHGATDAVYWMRTAYTAYDNWSGSLRFANGVA